MERVVVLGVYLLAYHVVQVCSQRAFCVSLLSFVAFACFVSLGCKFLNPNDDGTRGEFVSIGQSSNWYHGSATVLFLAIRSLS
jgi:hypothetical protein